MEEYHCKVCFDDKNYKGCYACSDDAYEDEILYVTDYVSIPPENEHHSYYGKMSDEQPDVGVIYLMLDEHIKKIIDKRSTDFTKILEVTLNKFKKSLKEDIDQLKSAVKINKADVRTLQKGQVKIEKILNESNNHPPILKDEDEKEMFRVREALKKKGFIRDTKIDSK